MASAPSGWEEDMWDRENGSTRLRAPRIERTLAFLVQRVGDLLASLLDRLPILLARSHGVTGRCYSSSVLIWPLIFRAAAASVKLIGRDSSNPKKKTRPRSCGTFLVRLAMYAFCPAASCKYSV